MQHDRADPTLELLKRILAIPNPNPERLLNFDTQQRPPTRHCDRFSED